MHPEMPYLKYLAENAPIDQLRPLSAFILTRALLAANTNSPLHIATLHHTVQQCACATGAASFIPCGRHCPGHVRHGRCRHHRRPGHRLIAVAVSCLTAVAAPAPATKFSTAAAASSFTSAT